MNGADAHILVSGLVQGVGFRFFAARKATLLGITGFVRNLPDGRVEAVARGHRGTIEAFVAELNIGPRAARIASVTVDWIIPSGEFDNFDIL
jgi:acylphosphatase